MWKNYFLVAYRGLSKNKTFSFINIFGLALGITCSLLIFLWVKDEKSINNFHANGNRLFAITERQYIDNTIEGQYSTPGVLGEELKKKFPEVEKAANFAWQSPDRYTFEASSKILKKDGCFAGVDYFDMFSYPLILGKPATALNGPLNICLSESMAKDFFGSAEAAFGKTIRWENKKDLKVTAVFADLPQNVTIKFDYLINWEQFLEDNSWAKEWGNNGPQTFVMLRADANPQQFEKKITRFLDAYNKDQSSSFRIELGMQSYGEMYLHSSFKNGVISGGRIEYVRIFTLVAIFILLIACINFMNLTTARSVKRAREIGVRKVIGAVRARLIRQFLGEAIFITALAVVVSIALLVIMLPFFNQLTQKSILLPFSDYSFWLMLTGLTLVTGLIAGSYPSFLLSSFKPIRVLKGTLKFNSSATLFRKGLVVFQFVLSIILIIGTIVISKQVNYVQSMNLGFDRENLVYIPLEGELTPKYTLFKERALKLPGIKSVSRVTQSPTTISMGTGGIDWDGKTPNTSPQFTHASIGLDFSKVLNLKLVQGRDLSKDFATDSVAYILNETALKVTGIKDPIGKRLGMWGTNGTIVGIVKDFHFASMHETIRPLVLRYGENESWGTMLVRTEAGKTKEAMASLQNLCAQMNPKFPFTYTFSDAEYQSLYRSEQVIGKLSNYFAFLAILISCLGLLGLAMFTAQQRTKEIGIRKVLGANLGSLFSLLSKEFLWLVIIALLIASPVAWWAMNTWLKDYAYKTDIDWWIFLIAGIIVIIITVITVSSQTLKAAFANPVKSLRTE